MGSPSGLHTEACICHSLLYLMDMGPANRQKFKGSHLLVPHGMQYKTRLPIIAEPHNHCRLLMDLKTGEPYPMEVVGNFCLKDAFFPSCLGDSFMFHAMILLSLQSRDSVSPPTEKEQQCLPIAQSLTSLLAPRKINRSLLAKMRSPAVKILW